MATVKYYIRKTTGNNPTAIYCRFSHGKEVDQRARTGQTVIPTHWLAKTQRVKNVSEATYKDVVNTHLDKLRTHINATFASVETIEADFLADAIYTYNNPDAVKGVPGTLIAFTDYFLEQQAKKNLTTGTMEGYYTIKQLLSAFLDKKDIPLAKVDNQFYDRFLDFMITKKKYAANTIGLKITLLKRVLSAAIDYGMQLPNYRPNTFKKPREEAEHVYLNATELKMIEGVKLEGTQDRVRDLFLVGAWTGLRYSDWGSINGNRDGDYIRVKTQKTGKVVEIPIHSTVHRILDKYPYGLPKAPAKPHFNILIREVCQLAGIVEKVQKTRTTGGVTVTRSYQKYELVSSHTARRSFATNAYKMGIPSITIMAITGHTTETSFLKYIKVTPKEHATKILEIWRRSDMKVVNYND